ncbi:ABC-three component system middle component 7 [Pseudomonas kilonensis]|uniref:ABC-three component system middle component 7 n=1 Tax=Pseudomonas kilonensis TaxID=132476 RepID=UPI000A95ACD0
MICPNKLIPYTKSALGHVEKLYPLIEKSISVAELYNKSKKHFESIDSFIYTLTILHLVDQVHVDLTKGIVYKC